MRGESTERFRSPSKLAPPTEHDDSAGRLRARLCSPEGGEGCPSTHDSTKSGPPRAGTPRWSCLPTNLGYEVSLWYELPRERLAARLRCAGIPQQFLVSACSLSATFITIPLFHVQSR